MGNIIDKILEKIKNSITVKSDGETYDFENINTEGFNVVAYFKDGNLYKVTPEPQGAYYDNRDMIYNADAIVSDGILYDLSDAKSIQLIPTPSFSEASDSVAEAMGVTGGLDYVLRMKAGQYYNENNALLCSACLWKSTELMFANTNVSWSKEDYMRLVYWHNELGMSEEAEKSLEYINIQMYKQEFSNTFNQTAIQCLNSILSHGVDLVVFSDYGHGCCEKCAPFRGRVYSISGKNKKYPQLPKYARTHGNFHDGCRCLASPYFGGLIWFNGEQVDALTASNRPFIDDRPQEQINNYCNYLKVLEDKAIKEQKRLNNSILRGKNKSEFDYFKENYPETAPKTIDGYIKGKRTNSKKFQQLVALAEKDGVEIDYSAI